MGSSSEAAASDVFIALAPDAATQRPEGGIKLGVVTQPAPRSADHLQTLHEWGDLEEIITITDAARLFAELAGQNYHALVKVLTKAVAGGEIEFWGLSETGAWVPNMVRAHHKQIGKPEFLPPAQDGGPMQFVMRLAPVGRLQPELMGITLLGLVDLLKARGRKVPAELLALVSDRLTSESESEAQAAPRPPLAPAVEQEDPARPWLTTEQVANIFGNGLEGHRQRFGGFDEARWRMKLEDAARTKWLLPHRRRIGSQGNNSEQARWCPLGIAESLMGAAPKGHWKDEDPKEVYRLFLNAPELKPWREAFMARHEARVRGLVR